METAPITPWPLPREVHEVILVGGTFDPPHRAHVELPRRVQQFNPGSWLLYVPAATSPFKANERVTPSTHRLAMLKLAIEGLDRVAIWTDELDRAAADPGQPSYTIDTLRRARLVAPDGAAFRLLMGADQAVEFHRWREFREVLRLAEPLVVLRKPLATREALAQAMLRTGAWRPSDMHQWTDWCLDEKQVPTQPISATEIRKAITSGALAISLIAQLDPKVAAYIDAHGLYA